MSLRILFLLAVVAACSDDPHDFAQNQGVCTDLGEPDCARDSRCQLVYRNSHHQLVPVPIQCVLVDQRLPRAGACDSLSFNACRTRPDCSLMFWQDLGPDDGEVGEPYYKNCFTEGSIRF